MDDKNFRGIIRKYMEIRKIKSFEKLIEGSPVGSYPTFRKKWKNPALFTIRDIDFFIDKLNVIKPDDRSVLKGEKN